VVDSAHSGPAPVPAVVCADEQEIIAVDTDRWRDLAVAVLQAEGRHGELTVTFVDRTEMAELNGEHMGEDGATDVLSFPLDADDTGGSTGMLPVLLGDVVICPQVAQEHAPRHAGSLDDELALLVVHGILHVLGHDHRGDADTRAMRSRELELLEAFHWGAPAPETFSLEHLDD
jgi:probable rRNA maturation factor